MRTLWKLLAAAILALTGVASTAHAGSPGLIANTGYVNTRGQQGVRLTTVLNSYGYAQARGYVLCSNGVEYTTVWVYSPTQTTVYRYCPIGTSAASVGFQGYF